MNNKKQKERRRKVYSFLIILVILSGLASRYFSNQLPYWVELYVGDSLWAFNVFLLLGFIFIRKSSIALAAVAFIFSLLIELSQLYHTPWIDTIRAYKVIGIILGYGFRWSDLLCYFIGIAIGVIIEKISFAEKFLFSKR
jgi:hypothetical protein